MLENKIESVLVNAGIYVKYNTFTDRIMVKTQDQDWSIINTMARSDITMVLHNAKTRAPQNVMDAAILKIAARNRFHPVKDYLDKLEWDGVPRVDTWLHTYFATDDNPFTRAVGALFLIAAVRRVRQPGCKFDECLVLTGKEGLGKSSAVQILAGEWFSDSLPLGAGPKETVEQTQGVWLSESAELVGNSPTKVHQIKAFLSRWKDGPFRGAYERESGDKLRQFLPVATTNEAVFLFSKTGDRRFWPIDVKMVDTAKLTADRDQLWAEAATREAKGESIRLNPKLWDDAESAQAKYRTEDPWETQLKPVLENRREITLPEIFSKLNIPTEKQTIGDAQRIAGVMQKLKFLKKREQKNGVRTTTYERMNIFDSENFDYRPETAPEEPEVEDEATLADQYAESELEDYE